MSRPREEVDALINKIPDPSRRETRRSVVQLGVQAPEFVAALNIHSAVFDLAASFLQSQPWLAGESFSLADCALMPYALRADHLGLANEISDRPALSRWYDAIRARPAFTDAVTAWLPEPAIAGFRAAGDAVANEIASLPR
jgi:glutathione S-transferase